ncbi:FAD synthase-like isoform X2 [Teleopsis dalmanni]|uniref:FAD synthase-like isoform X2 n=1 Tax=Teleopsis dalmanni TaxID=139649 RepID=UPI000D329A5A|nr:FAD synthase-like isoform X2 [Teleopsis dalmanni]
MKCLEQEPSDKTAETLLLCSDKPDAVVTKNASFNNSRTIDMEKAVITQSLQIYKPVEIMLSFNGGKDCTVVLHILAKYFQQECLKNFKIPALYIQDLNSFEEVDDFVESSKTLYNIELIKRTGRIKEVLFDITNEMPHIKAIFMGCRRTDPFCGEIKVMQPCDFNWPAIMRINPIIDWKCVDVWNYLKSNYVPYCSLYDLGYTSIGNKNNTIPNPHLKIYGASSMRKKYRPAYELEDDEYDSLERAGRFGFSKTC